MMNLMAINGLHILNCSEEEACADLFLINNGLLAVRSVYGLLLSWFVWRTLE